MRLSACNWELSPNGVETTARDCLYTTITTHSDNQTIYFSTTTVTLNDKQMRPVTTHISLCLSAGHNRELRSANTAEPIYVPSAVYTQSLIQSSVESGSRKQN